MGDYPAAASFNEATMKLAISEFGPDTQQTAEALNNLAVTYDHLRRFIEAETLVRRAIDALASSRARICLAMARRASVPLRALRYSSLLGLRTISRFERFDGVPQVFDDRDGWVISH